MTMATDIKASQKVADFQHMALGLGYKPGPIDGDQTPKGSTEAAILDVRNNLGLPLKPTIDAELLKAMETAGPKPVSERQATATADEIAPKVESVKQTIFAKWWAKVGVVISIITSIPVGIINHLGEAIEHLTPLKVFLNEFLSAVQPLTVIFIAILAVAIVSLILFAKTKQAEAAAKDAYNKGTLGDDNRVQPILSP